jgi:hypothetical protein
MSRNIIFVLICHRHKLFDLILNFARQYITQNNCHLDSRLLNIWHFWNITPRSPLKVNRRFRGCRIYHNLQSSPDSFSVTESWRIRWARHRWNKKCLQNVCRSLNRKTLISVIRKVPSSNLGLNTNYFQWGFAWFLWVLIENCRDSPKIRPWPLLSTSSPIHYSLSSNH